MLAPISAEASGSHWRTQRCWYDSLPLCMHGILLEQVGKLSARDNAARMMSAATSRAQRSRLEKARRLPVIRWTAG